MAIYDKAMTLAKPAFEAVSEKINKVSPPVNRYAGKTMAEPAPKTQAEIAASASTPKAVNYGRETLNSINTLRQRQGLDPMGQQGQILVGGSYGEYMQPQTEVQTFYKGLEGEESRLRQEYAERAQEAIRAIEAQYAGELKREEQEGVGREGQTRALASRSGTLGQDIGQAQQAKTQQFNQDERNRIIAQKDIAIQGVMKGFDQLANQRVELERQTAFAEREEDLAKKQELLEQGKQNVDYLASRGLPYSELDPNTIQTMKEATGMTDLSLFLRYNQGLPQGQKPEYKFESLSDGNYLMWGQDPVTGELIQQRFQYDTPEGAELKIIDDKPYFVQKDENGRSYLEPAEGFKEDPYKLAEKELGLAEKELGLTEKQLDILSKQLGIDRDQLEMQIRKQQAPMDLEKSRAEIDKIYKEMEGGAAALDSKDRFDLELKLGNHFDTVSSEYRKALSQKNIINSAWEQAQERIKNGESLNAVGQAIGVTFQKALDPTSVVRESEFARTAEGQSLVNRAYGLATKWAQGGVGLSKAEMEEMVVTANNFMEGYEDSMADLATREVTRAKNMGLNVDNILSDDVKDLVGYSSLKGLSDDEMWGGGTFNIDPTDTTIDKDVLSAFNIG